MSLPWMLFPALSNTLISILLVRDCLCDARCALHLSVSFPLYFSLIVSSISLVTNPSQAHSSTLRPGAGQESSTTANTPALAIVVDQQGCCKSRTEM